MSLVPYRSVILSLVSYRSEILSLVSYRNVILSQASQNSVILLLHSSSTLLNAVLHMELCCSSSLHCPISTDVFPYCLPAITHPCINRFIFYGSSRIFSSLFLLRTVSYGTIFSNVRKIALSDYYLRHVCLSVRPTAWNTSGPAGRIFMKFDI